MIVVDLFGKTDGGTFVGDKLAYYIWKTTGTGMVVDGGMFWLGKIIPPECRRITAAPGRMSLGNVMLTGINIPIRIGNATVMPGDVVLGDEEGLFFIPPHLVKAALDAAARAPRPATSGSSRRWTCGSTSPASCTDGRAIPRC